jgi:hypothetical protein
MEEETHAPTKRYLMIELSCDEKACSPCTYPNCQRYARLQTKNKKLTESVKPIATKELEVVKKVEKAAEEPKYPYQVSRYILTELSCSNAKCSPCTYPNCQRYSRTNKKIAIPKGSPVVSVTEIKGGKELKKLIESPKKS